MMRESLRGPSPLKNTIFPLSYQERGIKGGEVALLTNEKLVL
jgi:hypothetical protein